MPKPRAIFVDGSSLVYRAFFALPASLQAPSGLPTNAIYGFARMFDKILAGRRPAIGAVVFDAPRPTFRDRMYAGYKADRAATPSDLARQFPWVEKLVAAHRFPLLRVEGVEADDVIGTLTTQAVAAGYEVVIVSIDKDFMQLLSEEVRMVDTMRDITYTPELATRKWGVPPAQFVDLVALLGDKLDNIPGVPGIGKKGAVELVRQYGSLEGMLARADELPARYRRALCEQAEQARLCKALATIRRDVPLPMTLDELALRPPDTAALDALYRELAFYSLLSASGREAAADVGNEAVVVTTAAALARQDLSAQAVGLHLLLAHPGTFRDRLLGVGLAIGAGQSLFVPWPAEPELRAALSAWLEDPDAPKVIHGARNAWTALDAQGIALRGVVGDPGLASFLVDPAKNMPHRLDQVVRESLRRPLPVLDLREAAELSAEALARPIGAMAAAALEVWPILRERLVELELWPLYADLDLPLSWVLGRMQAVGIAVDRDDLVAMGREFAARKAEVEQRIYALAGREFNVDSPKQLATVLFEELALPVLKRTKTGYSTAADVLERLAEKHEIAAAILRQRALAKLISTYTNVLRDAIDPRDGRIHAAYEQTVGVSGRIISTDPDLQRTPIRTEDGKRVRRAFVARPGWSLVCADWSQIDLRVLAHFSGDARLRSAFEASTDVHARTAALIFDVPIDAVTSEQRRVGKTVNFATIYGQGAIALSQQLGIAKAEAAALIERYFASYDGVRLWRDRTIAEAHRTGGVSTLLGRRRAIPELSSRDATERAHGERIALNTPVQGTVADLCKLAMLAVDRELLARELEARMLMQIHDELVLEAPPDEVDEVVALVRAAMERPHPLEVALEVNVGVGPTWADAHP